jgi:ADP-heptose:LPS heptosyltransferase
MSRLPSRLAVLPRAALSALKKRRRPGDVRRILIAHNLLLGDTLMLTALIARLRAQWPQASISMTVAPALAALYAGRPYGVDVLPYHTHRASTTRRIVRSGPYDLAFVPGDNRSTWLARAAGARWVVALDEPGTRLRNRAVDESIAWPTAPMALADMFASLAGADGDETYDIARWPAPTCEPFDRPAAPYCVLHVGAGSPLRHWPAERWMALAQSLAAQGVAPVWSGSAQEAALIAAIDPQGQFASCAGTLSLAQLWHLLQGAALLVVPDTGIAHLAKLTGTPTVCLFGPGSDVLFGAGRFWRKHRFVPVIEADFPCRDQRTLFGRRIEWVRRCQRSTAQCPAPACMHALDTDRVIAACRQLLGPA